MDYIRGRLSNKCINMQVCVLRNTEYPTPDLTRYSTTNRLYYVFIFLHCLLVTVLGFLWFSLLDIVLH